MDTVPRYLVRNQGRVPSRLCCAHQQNDRRVPAGAGAWDPPGLANNMLAGAQVPRCHSRQEVSDTAVGGPRLVRSVVGFWNLRHRGPGLRTLASDSDVKSEGGLREENWQQVGSFWPGRSKVESAKQASKAGQRCSRLRKCADGIGEPHRPANSCPRNLADTGASPPRIFLSWWVRIFSLTLAGARCSHCRPHRI